MLLLLKVFSAGLVPRCGGEWPNCGHSLVVAAGLPGAGVPTAPAGAAMAATPNGTTSATMPARVASLDVGRISPPAEPVLTIRGGTGRRHPGSSLSAGPVRRPP